MNMGNEGGANISMSSMSMNDNSSASISTIVNTTDYETAQAIAKKINEVFNGELSNALAITISLFFIKERKPYGE